MAMNVRSVVGALALLVCLGVSEAQAQHNPGGWIQTSGWNLLFPLGNPDGCGGGGTGKMAGNWVAPYQIGLENPREADEWTIDFGGSALATGWGAGAFNPKPIWVTVGLLEATVPGLDIVPGDVIDYQGMVDLINGLTGAGIPGDNVLGIATTYVENLTGAPLAVQICSASDDSIAVYVNNVLTTNVSSCRGTAGDCNERFPAILQPGMNKIATLTFEGGGGWGFRLAVEVNGAKQADGSALLRFVGAGTNEEGQVVHGATRSIALDPFICDNSGAAINLLGNGVGPDSNAVTVVETITSTYAADWVVDNISDGGVLEDAVAPVGLLADHRVVGAAPCGGGSTTLFNDGGTPADPADDEYTSISQTGRDLWDAGDPNNDSIEFAYSRLRGDFDVAIMITGKENTTATRWGKWGLMARWDYDRASRYTIMQDHSNDPQDPCRLAGRTVHRTTGNMYEDLQGTGDPAFDHPAFMRLQRQGNIVRGYISNDGATWNQVGRNDDWGASCPQDLLVGFANSQHNSGGCGVQTVKFKIIAAAVTASPAFAPLQKKITWNTTAGVLNAGLSYDVALSTVGSVTPTIDGEVVGESSIAPSSTTLTQIARTGPVGIFDDSHDIGTPPTRGSTTYDAATGKYTVFGSGGDIWDGGDQFQFAYKHVTGDFVATARIASRGTNACGYRWGRHGLMARSSCRNDAKFTMLEEMFPTDCGEYDWIRHHFRMYDNNAGNNRDYLQVNDGIFPTQGQFPEFMRIVRRANAVYSYMSEDADGNDQPDRWVPIFADAWTGMPGTLLVGLAVQGRQEWGQTAVFDQVSITPLSGCYDFEPIGYEVAATNSAGIGSRPYKPIQVVARIPNGTDDATRQADAVAHGGAGFGVKNRNWYWSDLTAGSVDLAGTTQLLWNNENRNFPGGKIRYVFHSAAKLYIAWDNRLVIGGSDYPAAANGWFDVGNDVGTLNAQGWLRLTGRSDDTTPIADEIRTTGDGAFARGGVWTKEVAAGDTVDFLNTVAASFTSGRSPYVVFVDCLDQVRVPGGELVTLDYEGADDMGVVVVRSGGFTPQVVNGRLRITSDANDSSGTAVWYGVPADPAADGVPLLADGFVAEFDAFLTHSGQANPDFNPADNLGFVVVATGKNDGLASAIAPFVPGLDVASLCGDGGGSLGYHGGTMMERTETHPNFMIEMDTWYGSSDAVNEPYGYGSTDFDGKYHFGLNVAGQANSVQTCAELGIPAAALPNIFGPAGVHVEVMYQPTGQIDVWASGVDYNGQNVTRLKVLSTAIQPLTAGDLVLGFVGGTGGAVQTGEIDNFTVSTVCSEQPDLVEIAGPASFNQLSGATYSASIAGAETGSTVEYTWQIVSGDGSLSATTGASVDLSSSMPGEIVLEVTADDGACGTATQQVRVTVLALPCDLAMTCAVNADETTVKITLSSITPVGCDCDQVSLKRDGVEIFAGALADVDGKDFPLPAGCEGGTEVTYTLACTGDLGTGATASCTVTCPIIGIPFIRGDCNQDGEVCRSVSDIVALVMVTFLGEAQPSCPAACDANGDGEVFSELSDVMYIANYCFTGLNAAPPAPFPACGIDEDAVCEGPTFCAP